MEKKDSSVHDGHRSRLRARAMEQRLRGFQAHEVLELLLFYAIPRRNVNPLAHALIDRFGSVDAVLRAPEEALTQVDGVGKHTAQWLRCLGDLVEAYMDLNPADRPLLTNHQNTTAFLSAHFSPKWMSREQTWQFLLNREGRLISSALLCDSLIWGTPESLQEAVSQVLAVEADSVLLVELMPNRPAKPTELERSQLERLSSMLCAMGVKLLDCVLMGDGVYSMHYAGDFQRGEAVNQASSALREAYLSDDDPLSEEE